MAVIQNQANLTYTYGTTTATVASNVAETERNASLSVQKRSIESAYRAGATLTYLVSIQNSGAAAIENAAVSDDLGAYTPVGADAPIVPLTFSGNAALYLNGVFSQELTPVPEPRAVQFTIPSIPAGGNALLIYQAVVNGYAQLETGSVITNTVSVGDEPLTASATVPVAAYADVSIEKEMSPNPITDGGQMTVTFTIENRGNVEATDLILTDDFALALSDISVTADGVPFSDFTFEGNRLTLPSGTQGTLSVPAATFSQDETGLVSVTPGVLVIMLTATV